MLKERIERKEPLIGMHVWMSDPASARIAGLAGYDFVWLDFEHDYISLDQLFQHMMIIQASGTPVIVRAPQNDLTATKKILEMGPDGIIFPMLRSAEEVKAVLDMTLYPPYGNRGFGPLGAINFGLKSADEFGKTNHKTMCRFMQIEHKDIIDDLDRVMEIPYIDGFIFGPCDLSGSLGCLGDVRGEATTAAMKGAIARLKAKGKYLGLATFTTDEDTIRHWHDMGIDMLSCGCDYEYVRVGALETLARCKNIYKGEEK